MFEFQAWPTTQKYITQPFGANPKNYEKFGLPGHEGIDISAPFGTPYYAVAPGMVIWASDQRRSGGPSAYGWHVIVQHAAGYSTLYAHAAAGGLAVVGTAVSAGDVVGISGNSGNSTGPHLHLTLKQEGFQLPGWPAGYMDPWPFLESLV
jgi:murein DD-endopeptidase MepM/ murein hydrolase activator NlpD